MPSASSPTLAFLPLLACLLGASAPDAEQAAAAWQRAQRALAGAPQQEPAPEIPAANAILRLDGRVLGHGAALASPDRSCVDAAMAQAIEQASKDAEWLAWASRPSSLAEAVTLELELAGEPQPITARTLADCAAAIRPALDAMAVRRGATMHWIAASRLQSMGLAARPIDGLGLLMRRAGLADADLPSIDPAESVAVYRLDTIRLANSAPGAPPWLAVHGERTVPMNSVTPSACVAAAERAAGWLDGSFLLEPGATEPILLGDYGTIADRRQPMVAGSIDRMMAAWAFAELAARSSERSAEWRRRSLSLLEQAADPADDVMTARRSNALRVIAWCALVNCGSDADRAAARERLAAASASLAPTVKEEAPADAARALELAAAARAQDAGAALLEPAALHGAIARAWEELPRASLVADAEWLLRAAAWSGLEPPPSPVVLDALRDILMRAQLGIGSAPKDLPVDLVGAFQLASASGQPSVGISGLRPLAALLRMIGPAPDEATRGRIVDACRAGARFVMQVQVSPDGASLLRRPRRCVGGLRESLWEPRISVAGTAAGILVLLDLSNVLPAGKENPDPS